jgi:hypothetical protein
MNSRERVMAALHLKKTDRVPFMDFADTVVTQKIMGTEKDLDKIVLPNPHDENFYDPAKRFMEKYHHRSISSF